jgi:predicted nucleic-acid-binding protein
MEVAGLIFDSEIRLFQALDAYEHGKGDFADYLIREQAQRAGCKAVYTFDRRLQTEDGFKAP